MSVVAPAPVTASAPTAPEGRLTFGHLVRSEWIKLVSLRSTWWTLGLTVLGMVGFSLMMAASVGFMVEGGVPEDALGGMAAQIVTFGYFLGQITVAVLGALVITGEYSTGMIRSTMTAAPGRIGPVAAKATVLAVVVTATTLLGIALSSLVSLPLISQHGVSLDLGSGETWRILVGSALYLALIALLAFGLGLILRSSAGSIAAVLAVLLMLPIVLQILSVWQPWALDVMAYLPGTAGERIMAPEADVLADIDYTGPGPWQGLAILAAYVAVTFGVGLALLKKRDV